MSQDWNNDISKHLDAYKNVKNFHIRVIAEEYDTYPGSPIDSKVSDIYRDGTDYFFKIDNNVEVLATKSATLIANHQNKKIVYTQNSGHQNRPEPLADITAVNEEMAGLFEEKEYIGIEDGLKHYRLSGGKQHITEANIYLDISSGICRKFIYKSLEGYWMSITVDIFDPDPDFPDGIFNEKRYILSRTKSSYRLAPKYSTYSLISPE